MCSFLICCKLLLVLHQEDWVERTATAWVEWSNLTSPHPCGWRRFSRRNAGCSATWINKPLAAKEADAVNICPQSCHTWPRPSGFHSVNSPYHSGWWVLNPDRLNLAQEPPQSYARDGRPLMRFCKHGSETWNEISLLSLLRWERKPHLTLFECLAALPLCLLSARACLTITKSDR